MTSEFMARVRDAAITGAQGGAQLERNKTPQPHVAAASGLFVLYFL